MFDTIPSRLEQYNIHNVETCHAVGCRKHTKLMSVHNGKFCNKHSDELHTIRRNLNIAKTVGNLSDEIKYRQMETLFRKTMEPRHMFYLNKLENKTSSN